MHWKRPWCWERSKTGGEENDRGRDSWMTSLTKWTWFWASSRRSWRTRKPAVLQSRGGKESDTTEWLNNNKVCHSFSSKNLECFSFMAAVSICSDFGAPQNSLSLFPRFPIYLSWSDGTLFSECCVLSQLFHPPLSPSSRGSLVPLCFLPEGWCHLHIWGYWYFSRQSWFQLVLHPALHSTWCTLHISWISRVTVYILDVILSHFETSSLFLVGSNCCIWPAYRFLRRLVRRYDIPISLRIFYSLLWSTQSKASA